MLSTRSGVTPRTVWLFRLAIALLPALVLFRQDNPLFVPPHNIDSWMYLGYFRHLEEFKTTYRATYYGSRLGWILPGWAVHSLFTPLVGCIVMRLGVHLVATLGLFEVLRRTLAIRMAFLATFVFSMNPQLWAATGCDYLDGGGIAYCLVAMALFTGSETKRPGAFALIVAGIALGGMLACNLFLIVLTPAVALYWASVQWAWRPDRIWRSLRRDALWIGLGAGLLFAALCVINHRIDGLWWFYEPSFRAAKELYRLPNPWFRGVLGKFGLEPWLWFGAVALAFSLVELVRFMRRPVSPESRLRAGFAGVFLLALASMAAFQFAKELPVLGLTSYASYLLPFTYLALAGPFWEAAEGMSGRRFAAVCAAAAVVFALIWADFGGAHTPMWPAHLAVVSIAAVLLLAGACLWGQRPLGLVLAMAACLLITSQVRYTAGFGPKDDPPNIPPRSAHEYREGFNCVMRQAEMIDALRGPHRVYFWYDENEPNRSEYWALNSVYLFMYSRISGKFPEEPCAKPVAEGALVAISTRSPELLTAAREKLAACWAPQKLRPAPAAPDSTWQYITPYTFSLVRAEAVK